MLNRIFSLESSENDHQNQAQLQMFPRCFPDALISLVAETTAVAVGALALQKMSTDRPASCEMGWDGIIVFSAMHSISLGGYVKPIRQIYGRVKWYRCMVFYMWLQNRFYVDFSSKVIYTPYKTYLRTCVYYIYNDSWVYCTYIYNNTHTHITRYNSLTTHVRRGMHSQVIFNDLSKHGMIVVA